MFGADLTYGWNDDTGLKGWTVGGEYLVFQGDIGAEVDDNGTPANFADDTLQVLDSNRSGYYLWAQHAWDQYHSAGLLYSEFEHAEAGSPKDSEIVAWYSRNLTEMSRLRFGVRYADSDESGDSTALLVQFTNFFGSHAHGVNW
ncbi:MAG: hypothetical protein R3E96_06995 [Planctomycetota bacterium]